MSTTIEAPETLWSRAQHGIQYLVNHIREDGSFVYEQNAKTGKIADKYNILRHAGCLLVLYQYLNQALIEPRGTVSSLDKATEYLLKEIKPIKGQPDLLAVFEKQTAKLGGAALTLLALLERYRFYPEPAKLPLMRKLASFLVWMQEPSGKFRSKWENRHAVFGAFESGYYPGQAIFALVSLYAIDPDPRWLNAAEAGTNYLLQDPIKENGVKVNNHWFAYSLVLLYDRSRDQRLYTELNDFVRICIEEINRRLPDPINPAPDAHYASAWATFGETIVAAMDLEKRSGHLARVEELTPHARRVAAACLHLQIGYKDGPYKFYTLGAIRENEKSDRLRIDFVQHVLAVVRALV